MNAVTGKACAALVVALAAGCASVPRATNEVESARAAYRAAAANPQVRSRAPVELEVAERALADAERLHQADAEPARVVHFAYLAERRAQIATETARMRAAEAAIATASQERSRMQLELSARERQQLQAELDAQRREATLARERAARQAELAAQQAQAQREAQERASSLSGELSRLQLEMQGIGARETERGWVLTLREDLLFDTGSTTVKASGAKALERLAGLMQKQPSRPIAIEGFTDSTGAPEANRRLSEARAAAVKQALVERGVEARRVQSRGHGAAFPVASNQTEIGRQLNRRVEIVIAAPSSASAGGATR